MAAGHVTLRWDGVRHCERELLSRAVVQRCLRGIFCFHLQGEVLRKLVAAALHAIGTFSKLVVRRWKGDLMCSVSIG